MSQQAAGADLPDLPAPDFSAEQTEYVGEANVDFIGTNGGGPASSYRWSWGDNGEDTTGSGEGAITSHYYAGSGEYTVSYTLYNAAGSVTETKTDYITVT